MDKLHGTPNTTNCGKFYTTSFSLFFSTFEVCSSMNNFTLDTFVFDIFERCKIIICSFIANRIGVDIFELCKSFRCSRRSITFSRRSCLLPYTCKNSILSTRSITFWSKLSYFHVLFHNSSIGVDISKL